MDYIIELLKQRISNPFLLITLASALPAFELKGGIFLAATLQIPPLYALLLCYIGSCTVIPIILLGFPPLLALLKKTRFGKLLDDELSRKAYRLSKSKNAGLALFLFVAFPAPLTGVWSGAAIASLVNMPLGRAFCALFSGNLLSALIILLISLSFPDKANLIFGVFLALMAAVFLFGLLSLVIRRKRKKKHDAVN